MTKEQIDCQNLLHKINGMELAKEIVIEILKGKYGKIHTTTIDCRNALNSNILDLQEKYNSLSEK